METDHAILKEILANAASHHNKLCPRIVLGVRMGLAGAEALGMDIPRSDKRLLSFVETDGCFVSGVETATGCTVNHRTMRIVDYGKIAATFVEVKTGKAIRVAPRMGIRDRALNYAPEEHKRYFAMLIGYQRMPVDELLVFEEVGLTRPIESIISRAGVRVNCENCSEEIINEREVIYEGQILCQPCAGKSYFQSVDAEKINSEWFLSQKISSKRTE